MNAESSTPGSSLSSKEELLAYQGRWLRPAGLAALAAAFISVGGVVVQHAGLHFPSGNSDADQLVFVHAHSSRLILAAVVQAIGIGLYAVPLTFLFRAASARAERMRGRLVVLAWVGPLLLGTALIVISIAGRHVSDDFVKQAPAAEQRAREQAQHPSAPSQATDSKATTSAKPTTQPGTTTAPSGTTTAQARKTPAEAASDARENLADDIGKNYALASVAGVLQLMAILSVLSAFIYTSIWAMRTGLVTRGMGLLGVFSGVLLVIPILGSLSGIAVVIWFAILGLMFLGFWPRPLPPAWGAGEAIPWARPGDSIGPPPVEPGPPGTVEGSGREVPEQPLADEEPGNGEPPEPPYGETQGQRRKKRKRRG